MRQILIVCAMLLSATLASAEQRARGGAPPAVATKQTPAPARSAPPPPPPSAPRQPQTVAPPITMPFSPLMTPPTGGLTGSVPFTPPNINRVDMFRTGTGRRNPYVNRPGFPIVGGYGSGYLPYADSTPTADNTPAAQPVVTGGLRVSGTPAEAEVFIDSYFIGTIGDLEAGRPLTIEAGPHHLEIRAPGYQPAAVDIRVLPLETLTYRASLDRVPVTPRTGANTAAPMYLIPNCYLGNVPPRPSRLPSGCDIKQVQVLGKK